MQPAPPPRPTSLDDAKSYFVRHNIGEMLERVAADLAVYQPSDPRRYVHDVFARMLGLPESEPPPPLGKACTLRIYVECATSSGQAVDQLFRTVPHISSSPSLLRSWQQEGAACLAQVVDRALGLEAADEQIQQPKSLPLDERSAAAKPEATPRSIASSEVDGERSARVSELEGRIEKLSREIELLQKDRTQVMMSQYYASKAGGGKSRKTSAVKRLPENPDIHASAAIRRASSAPQSLQIYDSDLCTLRIITVSDIPELEELSGLDGVIKAHWKPNAITVMAGNFLGPSILSSLDSGKSMVDVMNRVGGVGIEYACLGTREANIAIHQLQQRISEFQGYIVNSNMPDLVTEPALLEYQIVDIATPKQKRKIGLVGLVATDLSLYDTQDTLAFGGALHTVQPLITALERVRKHLIENEGCDVVIPITHQHVADDRELASAIASIEGENTRIPVIIGGHEQKKCHEHVGGCHIVKSGARGKYVSVIDVSWEGADTPAGQATVSVEFIAAGEYPPNANLNKIVTAHARVLHDIEKAYLFDVPEPCRPLTSAGIQVRQTTVGTLLASCVRSALGCDCAILDAGAFLDEQSYPDSKTRFSYGDLKRQIPHDSLLCIASLPGAVLGAAVAFSRSRARADPPQNWPGFMQIDDSMTWDDAQSALTMVDGKPLEAEREYHVAVLFHSLNGMNRNQPLIDWANGAGKRVPPASAARPLKEVVVRMGCEAILQQLVVSNDFESFDTDRSGFIDRKEIGSALRRLVGEGASVPEFMVSNVMALVDADNDGAIDAREFNNLLSFFGQIESFRAVKSQCSLRIISVNDVYELGNLPFLDGVIRAKMRPNTITMLPGDFLAPSLLSSLDKGRGMVDMMNHVGGPGVGIQFVCFGNHETDVPIEEMRRRIEEYRGVWINTNMPDFEPRLPDHHVLEVEGGGQRRRVGLIGLLTIDKNLYRPGAFGGGIDTALPVEETAERYRKMLMEEKGCDLVIPMTHQVMAEDRQMARRKMGFPLLVGAHDHDPYLEEVEGCWIVKTGADATKAAIIDITWPSADTPGDKPTVEIELVDCKDYPENKELAARAREHMKIVEQMEKAYLTDVPPGLRLVSVGVRRTDTTVGRFLCSLVRDGFRRSVRCDGVIMDAGSIRRNHIYPEGETQFTYGDLKKEIPFDTEMVVVSLTGAVVAEAVAASRARAFRDPPEDWGGFLQLDDGMVWDQEARAVTHIGGAPIDPAREYHMGVILLSLNGMNRNQPLIDWANANAARVPPEEAARKAKDLIVERCSEDMIARLGKFLDIDTDGDGQLSFDEVANAMSKMLKRDVSEIEVRSFMEVIDRDKSGYLSREEFEDGIKGMVTDYPPPPPPPSL